MTAYLLAIDQGTTNSRAIVFDRRGNCISQHGLPLALSFPENGWVEQSPVDIITNTIACCREAVKKAGLSAPQIAAVGISNQRETTLIWEKHTGKAICPAIVWQDRRTSALCQRLKATPLDQQVQAKTGLLLDPYFSATKALWILENVPHARERAERGELLFGTVDTFLLWHLTKGKAHATDASNASRTMLFNIHTQTWDEELLQAFNVPPSLLPMVLDNTADFGEMDANILGAPVPITGMAGDQQAACVGQACFRPGMVKSTYGTGSFMLLNTGKKVVRSHNHLLATIAYRIEGKTTYGLEGSIFSAGATIKWLRDGLKLIGSSAETEGLARSVGDTDGVYLVPAFTGLGAPYWDPEARGALLGLTRNSRKEHIVRAALENVAYQTCDLLQAMTGEVGAHLETLRVDGGMVTNDWLLQFLADMLDIEVQRPVCIETTALGAACLAGLQAGVYSSLEEIAENWQLQARFFPNMHHHQRKAFYLGWQQAVKRVLSEHPSPHDNIIY